MKEILIKVSKETRMVNLNKSYIGNDGENLQEKLVFEFIDEFVNGQARLEYSQNGKKNYIVLNKENDVYTIPVKNVITKEGQINMQLVITETTNTDETPVFKSNLFYLFCNSSVNAVQEAPDGYEVWIEHANHILNKAEEILDVVELDGDGDRYLSDDGTYKSIEQITGNSDYNNLENKPLINNVELTGSKTLDELGIQPKGTYLTKETDPTVPEYVKNITEENINNWNNKSEFDGSYNSLTDTPDIPTKTSDLTNDSGFLTEHQDLSDYALRSELPNMNNYYNKTEIDEIVGDIESLLGGI